MIPRTSDCVIIGAGMAGLSAARELHREGIKTVLLDKGRNPGGRMASRYIDDVVLNHGAQSITATDDDFRRIIQEAVDEKLLTAGQTEPEAGLQKFVPTGGIREFAMFVGSGTMVFTDTRVTEMAVDDNQWVLSTEKGEQIQAPLLVLTMPVPQVLELFHESSRDIEKAVSADLRRVVYRRCIALLAIYDSKAVSLMPGELESDHPGVERIVVTKKPQHDQVSGVVIHSTDSEAQTLWDEEKASIIDRLLAPILVQTRVAPAICQVHRWRYSQVETPLGIACQIISMPLPLAIAGDAFGQGSCGIERAFCSGRAAGRRIIGELAS